jgi:hypothetical protein
MYKRIIKMVRDGVDAVLAEIARGRDEIHDALDNVVPDIETRYKLESVPMDQLSHDKTVMPAAARKKPNIAKMSGKKLRAYADELGVEYHHNHKDESIRDLINSAE